MKKLSTTTIALLLILLAAMQPAAAQGIYQFWGLTSLGGEQEEGTLFSTKYDGTGITRREAFEIFAPGRNPFGQNLTAFNGKLYGMMPNAGPLGKGIIYEYYPYSNSYTPLVDFNKYSLSKPVGQLVLLGNKMYGIVNGEGGHGFGALISFDPVTRSLKKEWHLDNLILGITTMNGKIYGIAESGEQNNFIFSWHPADAPNFKVLAHLNKTTGYQMTGLQPFNNKLYGVASYGGPYSSGTIIEFNPANNKVTVRAGLASINANWSKQALALYNNKLYGSTTRGGAHDKGVLFEYDPLQHTITKKIDYTAGKGYEPVAAFTVFNNRLYGSTTYGGVDNAGTLFEYNPATNNYTVKIYLDSSKGIGPRVSMTAWNNKLYGFTYQGGSSNRGVLFEYIPAANSYTKKIELGAGKGSYPYGKLVHYQGKLYGITSGGGNYGKGVIFSYDLATHTYAIRHHMKAETGYTSFQGGMVLLNNKLYGVTTFYAKNYGCLFEFDPATDDYTVKYVFTGTTGKRPDGTPVIFNNKLYGTTQYGGHGEKGTLYEFDPVTNACKLKVYFSGNFGVNPSAGLTQYKNKLYGTTPSGGAYNQGTLFEYDPVINGFAVQHHFSAGEGRGSYVALTVHNDKLFGTTVAGDNGYQGTLFEYDPASTQLITRHQFKLPDGASPNNQLLSHGGKIYGMTSDGGILPNGGTIFQYDPASGILTKQSMFNGNNGRYPYASALIALPALAAPGYAGACMNAGTQTIDAANNSEWVAFTDKEGHAVVEINANGNNLGHVTVQYYTHNGVARKDKEGRLYLDRNFTISVDTQPATPVSVRFYIQNTAFEKLKSTPGSGIKYVSDVVLLRNDDRCSAKINTIPTPIDAGAAHWGEDHVYTAQVDVLSTFWFAGKAPAVPVVRIDEPKPAPTMNIRLMPNPVTGSQAIFSVQSTHNTNAVVTIYDAMGRALVRTQWSIQQGIQIKTIDVQQLPAGIGNAVIQVGENVQTIRFIRQ